nr:hypothetical protein [Variovorax boronicumulans]
MRPSAHCADGPSRTPDGRYIVVKGRLWRANNPGLPETERATHVHSLMQARRALRGTASAETRATARAQVDAAKRALGERGPVWWTDGAPDYNRHLVHRTPYAQWHAALAASVGAAPPAAPPSVRRVGQAGR